MENRSTSSVYEFGPFSLDVDERSLSCDGKRIKLTPRNFELLLKFVENPDHLFEKKVLLNEVWKDANVEEGNLARTVSNLRRILGDTKEESIFIETIPRVGYRFIADVARINSENIESVLAEKPAASTPVSGRFPLSKVFAAIGSLLVLLLCVFAFINWRSRQKTADKVTDVSYQNVFQITKSPQDEQITGWTNDGKLRFVRWINSAVAESYVAEADGSKVQKVSSIPALQCGVWSPNGDKVMFSKNGDPLTKLQYLANNDGSDEIRLPIATENAAWSADGKSIVFQSAESSAKSADDPEVFTYDLESKQLTRITNSIGFDGDAAFSPDGKEIVFASARDGDYEIYIMDSTGGNVRRMTENSAHDSFPRFTTDGTGITFTSNLNGETTDIYFLKTTGGKPVRLTDWNSNELSRAGTSPDGTKIAFNSDKDGNDEIYTMDFEPDRVDQFLSENERLLQTPSFSRDGKSLVYSSEKPDKTGELRILDIESKNSRLIVSTSSGSNYPQFSPDGKKIAFHQEVDGRWDVFTIISDGTDLRNLTLNSASDSIPNWNIDGKKIMFRTNRNGESLSSELYSMNSDGTDQIPLLTKKGSLGWASVSGDGSKIIYSCDRGEKEGSLLDICIADSDGDNERVLLSKIGNDIQPVFSHDGKRIAFVASSDGNPEIYLANIDGTDLYRLTRNQAKDVNPVFTTDSRSIVFSSDRSGSCSLYRVSIPQ